MTFDRVPWKRCGRVAGVEVRGHAMVYGRVFKACRIITESELADSVLGREHEFLLAEGEVRACIERAIMAYDEKRRRAVERRGTRGVL